MRRKSERVKDKDKSSEKKDRSPKKSRRSSRRRKKSSSTSPEEESETDDYDVSFKSCKDDTEEEHSSSKIVSGKNTAEIETDTPILATEVEGIESPQVSGSRTRRHSKKQSDEVEEKQTAAEDVNESQEKVEGADAVGETLDKHKESENKSSVWQVKSTDCSGGEIKKLKLCIVRPPEPAEPEPRKRKKLSRMPHRETEVSPGESEGLATHDSPDEKRKSQKSASNVVEDSVSENRERHGHGSGGRKARMEDSSDDEQHRNESPETLPRATEVLAEKGKVEEGESSQEVNLRKKLEAGDSVVENKESNTDDNIVESSRCPEQAESAGSPDPFDKLKQAGPLKHISTEETLKPSSSPEILDKCHISLKETDIKKTELEADTTSNLVQERPKRNNSSEETPNDNSNSEKIPNTPDSSEERPKVSDSSDTTIQVQDTSEHMPKSQESPSEKGDDNTGTKSKTRDSLKDGQDSFACKLTTNNSSEKIIDPSDISLKKTVPRDSSDSEEERLNYRKMHESKKSLHRLTRHKSDTLPPALDTPEKTCETKATLKSSTFNVQTAHQSHDLQNSSKSTNKHTSSSKDSKHKEVPRDPPRLERKKYKSVDIHRNEETTEKPQVREKVSLKRSSRVNDGSVDVQISIKDDSLNIKEGDEEDGSTTVLENASIGPEPQQNLKRKRRWGASKSTIAVKKPTLSISSDSLKHLIPEVKPLPISEVQLTEDEDEEEEGEVLDKVEDTFEIEAEIKVETRREEIQSNDHTDEKEPFLPLPMVPDPPEGKAGTIRKISIISADAACLQRSPSPARHRASSVLFVTNLVRPFTVNQLRELLARTGTIVDNGFWIDKIKSKCYVQYETETEAQETRHALHGVRWPVSNPKQLCVDYAKKEDMDLARDLAEGNHIPRKTEPLKMDRMDGWLADQGRDKDREHILREDRDRERDRVRGKERHAMGPMELLEKSREAKMAVGIREWDLGKMDVGSFDERGFHREERSAGERERRIRKERSHRSPSREPPGRKIRKKDEEAPAKLLDDLFKKTKITPCVYWLPLTADQIVVKEEMRRKHMAEHERRMTEMRKAEKAERERQRARMQGRTSQRRFDDRERDKRRHRSPSGSSKK